MCTSRIQRQDCVPQCAPVCAHLPQHDKARVVELRHRRRRLGGREDVFKGIVAVGETEARGGVIRVHVQEQLAAVENAEVNPADGVDEGEPFGANNATAVLDRTVYRTDGRRFDKGAVFHGHVGIVGCFHTELEAPSEDAVCTCKVQVSQEQAYAGLDAIRIGTRNRWKHTPIERSTPFMYAGSKETRTPGMRPFPANVTFVIHICEPELVIPRMRVLPDTSALYRTCKLSSQTSAARLSPENHWKSVVFTVITHWPGLSPTTGGPLPNSGTSAPAQAPCRRRLLVTKRRRLLAICQTWGFALPSTGLLTGSLTDSH